MANALKKGVDDGAFVQLKQSFKNKKSAATKKKSVSKKKTGTKVCLSCAFQSNASEILNEKAKKSSTKKASAKKEGDVGFDDWDSVPLSDVYCIQSSAKGKKSSVTKSKKKSVAKTAGTETPKKKKSSVKKVKRCLSVHEPGLYKLASRRRLRRPLRRSLVRRRLFRRLVMCSYFGADHLL